MTGSLVIPSIDLRAVAPPLILSVTAAIVMLLDLLPPRDRKAHLGFVGLAGVVVSLIATLFLWGVDVRAFRGMVALDGYALFFNLIIGYATGLVLLLSMDYIRRQGAESGEFYILVLLAAVGMMLMAGATDLIVIFLALETMSLALYVLAGSFRVRMEAGEASMKYFLLGAFASGFFLYGIALVFGATGSTSLDRIAAAIGAGAGRDPLLAIGAGLLAVGFGFKISSVPFHLWTADVYEGAPTAITAFIATGSKAAAFAALLRVVSVSAPAPLDWAGFLWVLAAVSMTLGNVVAIAQQNVKRMLAYSSIAHVGYMLVGVVAGGTLGDGSVLFYLLVYTFTTAGAFGVILLLERDGHEAVALADYGGLAARHPMTALALSVFLLSLVGIPPTAGFVGKFYLFGAAVRAGYVWLAVIGALNSAVAAYYYLRLIVYMYMREPEPGGATVAVPSVAGNLALVVALWGVVQLGVLPAPFLDLAQAAVAPLLAAGR
jgi:NADH-quinone oxidoreductase subunit N